MHTIPPPFYLRVASLVCLLIGIVRTALPQGVNSPVVMHTGTGSPLSSQSILYPASAGPVLTIDFGFATDEQPQPGFFADSLTVSITGPNGSGYLVTADANGIKWVPLVPGAVPVADADISRQTTPFLAPTEGLTNLTSYVLGYTLPPSWQGVPLNVNFDLFDNQNTSPSLAYFLVPVPEPSVAALTLLGLAVWWRRGRR